MSARRSILSLFIVFAFTKCAGPDRLISIFKEGANSIVDSSPISPITEPGSPRRRGCEPDYAESTGTLDVSYNGTGTRKFDSAGWDRTYANPVVTSDCKILNAFHYQGSNKSVVVKLGLDGTLEESFGNLGVADGFSGFAVSALLLLPGDRYILIGTNGTNLKLSRFLPNGKPDVSYNPAVFSFSGHTLVTAVELDTDGGVYVMFDQYLLKKFDTNGLLDSTFGNAGSLDTGLVATGWYHSNGLLLDSQRRIIVGGNDGQDFTIKRYSFKGILDHSFGTGGVTTVPIFGTVSSHIASLKFTADGKILAMGTPTIQANGVSLQYAFARFDSNGSLDSSFGNAGTIVSGSGGRHPSSMRTLQIDSVTGKFYTAAHESGWQNWRVERFLPDGSVDTSFGSSGYFESTVGTSDGTNFVLSSWGKLFAVTGSLVSIHTWMFK